MGSCIRDLSFLLMAGQRPPSVLCYVGLSTWELHVGHQSEQPTGQGTEGEASSETEASVFHSLFLEVSFEKPHAFCIVYIKNKLLDPVPT